MAKDKNKKKSQPVTQQIPVTDDYKDFLRSVFKSQKFNTGFVNTAGIPPMETVVPPYGSPGYNAFIEREKDRNRLVSERYAKAEQDISPVRKQALRQVRQLHPNVAQNPYAFGGVYGWGNDILDAVVAGRD
jgi:hypothetical protein